MQTQLTGPAAIVAVPAELGQVLADTSAWNDWALTLPRPARAPRVRRPGRIHRRVVALAAVAATAVVTLAGCAAAHHAPAAPGTPWLPGQVREVVHAAAHLRPASGPARPVWDGHGTYPNDGIEPLCPAADAGHVATVGTGPHAFRVVCAADGREYAWSATS